MSEKRFIRLGNPMFLLLLLVGAVAIALYWSEGRRSASVVDAGPSIAPAPAAPVAAPAADEPAAPVQPQVSPEAAQIDAARAAIVEKMKDPGSAQFRNERVLADGRTVCMEVNGKNAYGGYVGFQQAVVMNTPGRDPVALLDTQDTKIAQTACAPG